MNKNKTTILLCAAILASLGWGFLEHRRAQRLKFEKSLIQSHQTELTDLRTQLEEQQRLAQTVKANYELQIEQLTSKFAGKPLAEEERRDYENTIKALQSRIAQAGAASESRADVSVSKAQDPNSLMAELAKNLQGPDMNKLIESQQKLMIDGNDDSLFELLNLPENQLSAFKELLAKKQSELNTLDFEVMSNQASFVQRQANQMRIADATSEIDGEIKALLGKENYEIYKTWEESKPERTQVQIYNQSLGTDLQLSDAQKNDLIWAMHDARSAFKFTTGLDHPDAATDPPKASPELIARHMQETRQLNAQYIEQAGKFLSAPQLDKFRASLEQQQATQETEMKTIFGGEQREEQPGIPNQQSAMP